MKELPKHWSDILNLESSVEFCRGRCMSWHHLPGPREAGALLFTSCSSEIDGGGANYLREKMENLNRNKCEEVSFPSRPSGCHRLTSAPKEVNDWKGWQVDWIYLITKSRQGFITKLLQTYPLQKCKRNCFPHWINFKWVLGDKNKLAIWLLPKCYFYAVLWLHVNY